MSAAISVWKGYVIPEMPWCITCWICDGLSAHDLARTQPEAVAAGLAHLREAHSASIHECCVAHTCCVCATPRTERSHADA